MVRRQMATLVVQRSAGGAMMPRRLAEAVRLYQPGVAPPLIRRTLADLTDRDRGHHLAPNMPCRSDRDDNAICGNHDSTESRDGAALIPLIGPTYLRPYALSSKSTADP